MKNLIYFIFLSITVVIQSQEVEYTEAEKDTMLKKAPVYPGCEKYKDNKDLFNCFNRKFNLDIVNRLNIFELEYGSDTVKVYSKFSINEKGELALDSIGSNDTSGEFEKNVEQAFYRVKASLKRKEEKGQFLQPAINMNDKPFEQQYTFPVKFVPFDEPSRLTKKELRAIRRQERKMKK